MQRGLLLTTTLLIALAVSTRAAEETDAQRERGRYLTHQVAMCVQCHSPRNEDGTLIEGRHFHGAPIPVAAPPWAKEWAGEAPTLAGLPGREEEILIGILTTGRRPDGRVPRPPMPPFRMSVEDALAVAAYLRSLPSD